MGGNKKRLAGWQCVCLVMRNSNLLPERKGEANLEYEIIFTSHCQGARMMNLVCLCNDMRMSSLYVINGGSGP